MLQEVCCSVRLVGLGSRTGIDPYSYCRSLGPWRVLGSDLQSLIIRIDPSKHWLDQLAPQTLTVKPFLSVVVCVFAPTGDDTGVAKPRFKGRTADRAARLRIPEARFNASLLDAIGTVMVVLKERIEWFDARSRRNVHGGSA